MPKIFLIKNRLHQQQLRLLESQKRDTSADAEYLTPPGSPLSSECKPVALVVPKPPASPSAAPTENKPTVIKAKVSSAPATEPSENECAPRRFFSSILGGDKPYARHITFDTGDVVAKRQLDSAKFPITKKIATVLKAPKCQQVSVIQRGPTLSEKIAKRHHLLAANVINTPEQEAPIDYHVPKKPCADDDRPTTRGPLSAFSASVRSCSDGGAMCGGGGGGTMDSLSYGGDGRGGGRMMDSGGDGGGGSLGAGGGGDMGGGGRPNYGPSSPPTGCLPPFYESLKGNYAAPIEMECDTGQHQTHTLQQTYDGFRSPKQYQLLHNVCASYGLVPEDSNDDDSDLKVALDSRDPLPPVHLLGNSNYLQRYLMEPGQGQDSIMDHDPLQFTATLTFSSQAEHALLESLTDAAEIFLQRLPTSDEPLSNDSSSIPSPLEPSVQPYPENPGLMQKEQRQNNNYPFFLGNKMPQQNQYNNNSPPKGNLPDSQLQQLQIQVQLQTQQQQMTSDHVNMLPNFPNGIDLTPSSLGSPGPVSLPSPLSPENLSSSCLNTSGPASVTSSRRESSASDISSLPAAVIAAREDVQGCLTDRQLGIPNDMPIEFVNGGHGIKNPLANHDRPTGNRSNGSAAAVVSPPEEDTKPLPDDAPNRFSCRICSKTFTLQRLLNRHMKCHSDIKRYLCTFCGKGFNDTFDLKRHTRTHTGVRPYKCNLCEKSFTQRCSLESHCLKVHGVQHQYAYKERRSKMYVCEECGHTTGEPEVHYVHLKENHPFSPALLKFYDKRHFKFTNSNFANMLLQVRS
ncbi:transcriptional regulator ovo isoform X2 [Neocloeon triangulifer]|uniref:transcriptional regulator ovo isoform X2 n=1 Tax=Neocloeon triangulifer TaxID=2078957 RepID=UPI00286EF61A|nr:transcriptional regulator ovo isoform X2 [Neocloeon triangulifer]